MSEAKLPPQASADDTSNWENKAFTTPVVKGDERQVIFNGPERKRRPKNKEPISKQGPKTHKEEQIVD